MNLSLLLLAANVTLTWDPVTGAESYKLYVGIQSLKAGNPPLGVLPYDVYAIYGRRAGSWNQVLFCGDGIGSWRGGECVLQ